MNSVPPRWHQNEKGSCQMERPCRDLFSAVLSDPMICTAKSTPIGLVAEQPGNDSQRIVCTDFRHREEGRLFLSRINGALPLMKSNVAFLSPMSILDGSYTQFELEPATVAPLRSVQSQFHSLERAPDGRRSDVDCCPDYKDLTGPLEMCYAKGHFVLAIHFI